MPLKCSHFKVAPTALPPEDHPGMENWQKVYSLLKNISIHLQNREKGLKLQVLTENVL